MSELPTTATYLPDWDECDTAVKAGTATALQRFIHDNEPAGNEHEVMFRTGLAEVLAEALNAKA